MPFNPIRVTYRDKDRITKDECFKNSGTKGCMSESDRELVDDLPSDGSFPHALHQQTIRCRVLAPERRVELRNQGFKIRKGFYSKREKNQLRKNFHKLMNSEPIVGFWSNESEYVEVATVLFGQFKKADKPMGLSRDDILGQRIHTSRDAPTPADMMSCPQNQFWFQLGRKVPFRTIPDIREFVRERVVPLRTEKDLTEKERRKICRAKSKGKANWQIAWKYKTRITVIYHVFAYEMTPFYTFVNKDPFTFDEDKRLIKLIKRRTKISSLDQFLNLSPAIRADMNWTGIAMKMPGRSAHQCLRHFFNSLLPMVYCDRMQLMEKPDSRFNQDLSLMIVWLMNEVREGCESEGCIDWSDLCYRMHGIKLKDLQFLYLNLMSKVPKDEIGDDFGDKVEWLHDHYLPTIIDLTEEKRKELDDWINEPIRFGVIE